MRTPATVCLLALAVSACGASPPPHQQNAETMIRLLAADELDCDADSLGVHRIGEGDSSTGETVPLYMIAGCGSIAEYFCDSEGCQRHGHVRRCEARLAVEPDTHDCGLLNVQTEPPPEEFFDDGCALAPHAH